jgi:hypothetical protein
LPRSFPSISSNGRAEPSSTSAMRCCFSSSVLVSIVCEASSVTNISIITAMGSTNAVVRLLSSPLLMSPSPTREKRPSDSTATGAVALRTSAGSRPASPRRISCTRPLSVRVNHRLRRRVPALSE